MKAGELFIDVGVRGLNQAQQGLARLRERMADAGQAGGLLSRLSGTLATVGGKFASLAALAAKFAAGLAASLGAAAVATAGLLAEMGRSDQAGASLQGITQAWDDMTKRLKEIGLEIGELIARVFGIQGGIQSVTDYLSSAWEEWKPTFLAALDVVKMVTDTAVGLASTAIGQVSSAFNGLFETLGISLRDSNDTWAKTIQGWMESLLFFGQNWGTYLELWWEQFKLFMENNWERLKAFGQNVVITLQWIWNNWREIFETVGNFVVAVFRNAGENLKRIWTAVTEWIQGRGWRTPDLRPLTEGFKNTIKEMPQFVEANVRQSNERIDALLDRLRSRREAFGRERREREQAMLADLRRPDKTAAIQTGFVGFAELAKKQQEDALKKLAERQAKAGEQAAAGIMELVEAAKGPGLRIQGGEARFG